MAKQLQKEIELLRNKIQTLGNVVTTALDKTVQAIQERDTLLAKEIIREDDLIDQMEIDVEEECLKALALYQPVAIDLRLVVAVLKINNDLERVGDLAANIAQKAVWLGQREKVEHPFDLPLMLKKVQKMLSESINAFITLDSELARQVCASDDEVDSIHRSAYDLVKEVMQKQPQRLDSLIDLLSVSRGLERIADYATNIAEDVIYLVEGEIVRHKPILESGEYSVRPLKS